jgi:amino acid adenylation domain-containing protein/non-ribosomal peptide synthase protein (TIGR01720 family)
MDIGSILEELLDSGVGLSLTKHGDIRVNTRSGELKEEALHLIADHKELLVAWLESDSANFSDKIDFPLTRVSRKKPIAASFFQESLWGLAQLEGANSAYNLSNATRMYGGLDVGALKKAIASIIQRHEILRTHFSVRDNRVVQVIVDRSDPQWKLMDLQYLRESPEDQQLQLLALMKKAVETPFELSQGPLIRCSLYVLKKNEQILQIVIHHSVYDGWSAGILSGELCSLYHAYIEEKTCPLVPLRIQYADYAHWQRENLQGKRLKNLQEYWSQQLANSPMCIELPTDRSRPVIQSYRGRGVPIHLPIALTIQLQELSRKAGVTLFMTLLSAFTVLLYRYSGQTDISVGTPFSNRTRPELESLIGSFVNTLVLRNRLDSEDSFIELLAKVKVTVLEAFRYQDLPFEQLVKLLNPERSLSHSPLFQVMFVLQNMPGEEIALKDIGCFPVDECTQAAQFDLTFSIVETPDGLTGSILYATDLFDSATITRMAENFEVLLDGIVEQPDTRVNQLPILTEQERHQQLVEWNDIQRDYPKEQCIHELFEEQVEKTPTHIAVVFGEEQLTYRELNQWANQVAHHLYHEGVKPDTLVGLCVERSLEMVVGLLGIIKAGGAYVPIDPSYPVDRIKYMLEDSEVGIVLCQSHMVCELPITDQQLLYLDADSDGQGNTKGLASQPTENIPKEELGLTASHLAYVIYTSGSTGKPKGVLIEHENITRLFYSTQEIFHFNQNDIWTMFHSFAFDFSVWELWGALIYGGRLVVVPKLAAQSPIEFYRLMTREKVTVLNQTPIVFERLIDIDQQERDGLALRTIILGGEALNPLILKPWFTRYSEKSVTLINMYGITETTVHVTYQPLHPTEISLSKQSIIGKKLSDLTLYILDDRLSLVPLGVTGEIYVGGTGLARGYLNNSKLTQERFINNPFATEEDKAKGYTRLYKTGDLARWSSNGNLEYIGRVDKQIKIRGFRIELGEIEAQLVQHVAISVCVVIAREDTPGDKRLVAYVVPDQRRRGILEQDYAGVLRSHLQKSLPDFMIPNVFVLLETLPLTPNGKVDRKALPEPDVNGQLQRGYVAPQTKTENMLITIWAELLHLEPGEISVTANFFALGGHSLLLIRLITRLQECGLQTDVHSVYKAPTVSTLAGTIDASMIGLSKSFVVPPNLIPKGCEKITPDMLPLVDLSIDDIIQTVSTVPGGTKNIQDIYPLAPLQEGVLFHHLMDLVHDPYVLPALFLVSTSARLDAFIEALQSVIDRHDVLRTAVLTKDLQVPVQVVYRHAELNVGHLNLNPEVDVKAQLLSLLKGSHTMALNRAPLLKVEVVQDPLSAQWFVLMKWHHIVMDHVGFDIIWSEVTAHLTGQVAELPIPVPYREFVAQVLHQGQMTDAEIFFRERLEGIADSTAPFRLLNVRGDGSQIDTVHQVLPPELAGALRSTARRFHLSPAVLFHAAWALVVGACSGRDDVVFGTVLSGRLQGIQGAERMLGLFINTLPMRVMLRGKSVKQLIIDTDLALRSLLMYEQASLSLAQSCSGLANGVPLFSSLLNYRHLAPEGSFEQVDTGIIPMGAEERTNYPVTVSVNDLGEGFSIDAQIDRSVSAKRVIAYFKTAITEIVDALEIAPGRLALSLTILPMTERQQLLVEWNDTQRDYPKEQCIHELFEEQVEKTPNHIAVVFEEEQLTYRELNQRANQVAHHLCHEGVKPDTLVGLCVERSLEMVLGLLGIIKAGGTYVPIDPSYPADRIKYMLEDSGVGIVLCQSHVVGELPITDQQLLYLDEDSDGQGNTKGLASQLTENIPKEDLGLTANHLAYVIYTSGSTGKPKGVMVEHRGLVNYLSWAMDAYRLPSLRGALVSSPLSFDATISSLFLPLLSGQRTILLSVGDELEQLEHFMFESTDNYLFKVTPAHLKVLQNQVGGLCQSLNAHVVVVGGDVLETASMHQWLGKLLPNALYSNEYGHTETVVGCGPYWLEGEMEIDSAWVPLGRPIHNMRMYVLDGNNHPVPIGVPGELCAAGEGVTRGYWNRPALTAEKFTPDPFSDDPNAKLYRSGDRVRRLSDGTFEFLGRFDDQVKVRGFRIELGEIESCLSRCDGVRDCVVVVREEDAEKYLVAYVAPIGESLVEDRVEQASFIDRLRDEVKAKLPSYMKPSYFIVLESLPLTPNGKVDRKALPEPDISGQLQRGYRAPRTELERLMASIWCEVLKLEQVGVHDNFFELGGHSLLAMRLVSRIREMFAVELPLKAVFDMPQVIGQTKAITDLKGNAATAMPPIEVVAERYRAPVSFAQQRLWFLWNLDTEDASYNIPMALTIKGGLNVEALEKAFCSLLERHSTLRTVFEQDVDGELVQVISKETTFKLDQIDLTDLFADHQDEQVKALVNAEALQPFDLGHDLLLRARLLRLASEHYVLTVTQHHIASDGWSSSIFIKELNQLYRAYNEDKESPLEPLSVQYIDFSVWQRNWLQGEVLETQINYWREQLSGIPVVHSLPLDKPRPVKQSFGGAYHQQQVNRKTTKSLQQLSQRNNVTLFMTLQAAFSVLLSRYSGESDIIMGSPIANRIQKDVEPLIGFFVNTLVLRSDLSGNPEFTTLLKVVRENTLSAYAHQYIPFELLVEELNPPRSLSHSPLFQVMLVMQNNEREIFDLPSLQFTPAEQSYPISKFDLTLHIVETAEGLSTVWEYATDLFYSATIKRMANTFEVLLDGIIEQPDVCVHQLSLLTEQERHEQLVEWNDTKRDYPREKSIHKLFEKQVEKTPDNIAVVFEQQELTYRELNERANQQAYVIRSQYEKQHGQELPADTLIGLYLERSLDRVVSILAVLKAGGAYVPISPEYPQKRTVFILDDTQAPLLITQQQFVSTLDRCLSESGAETAMLVVDQPELTNGVVSTNPKLVTQACDLAYVIYTSGTTGTPKGVMVEHRSLCHLAQAEQTWSMCSDDSGWGWNASYTFDASLQGFTQLLFGRRLVCMPEAVKYEPKQLIEWVKGNNIGVIDCTPSQAAVWFSVGIDEFLPNLMVGGEAIDNALWLRLVQWQARTQREAWNVYGPTECTVKSTVCKIVNESPHIGRPLANVTLYLLNKHLQLNPLGSVSELYIGGAGVARGYLYRDALTKEKFIRNPFASEAEMAKGYTRLYKTGDCVRWLGDGNLEYLGRTDNQVKIRGYRIELGEIEAALSAVRGVKQAVVIDREREGHKYLAAYWASEANISVCEEGLREQLTSRLPVYMVPSTFTSLSSIPLTINGKLDRRVLPEPAVSNDDNYVAPRNAVEEQLCAVWQSVLGLDSVGIDDNFFRIGGDSIVSIQLVSRLRQAGFSLQVKSIFDAPTVKQLTCLLETPQGEIRIETEPGSLAGSFSLLPIQQWFFEKELANPNHWNQAFMISIPDEIRHDEINDALGALVAQHDMLHCRFARTDHGYHQLYSDERGGKNSNSTNVASAPLQSQSMGDWDSARVHAQLTQWQSHFDIHEGPLWQAAHLTGYEDGCARLYLAFHHLIIDTVSWRIISEDIKCLLCGQSLPEKGSSYRQWVNAVQHYADRHPEQVEYWQAIERAQRVLPATDPISMHRVSLSSEQTGLLLRKANQGFHTQINDLLLAALAIALGETFHEAVNHITLEGHGREVIDESLDITQTVGWFTTAYPVQLKVCDSVDETIIHAKECLRVIPDKGIGYGALVQAGELNGQLPAISFNYLGQLDNNRNEAGIDDIGSREWQIITHGCGEMIGAGNHDALLLNINGFVQEGVLTFRMGAHLSIDQAKCFVSAFESALGAVIERACDVANKGGVNTLSDFSELGKDAYLIKNEDASDHPFFLLPPGDGGGESYLNNIVSKIANKKLAIFNNLYSDSGLPNNFTKQYYCFEKLAVQYIIMMKKIQPTGPYHIFGWSFGAVLGLDIARQLEKAGSRVASLVLVDPYFNFKKAVNNIGENIYANDNAKNNINYSYDVRDQVYTTNASVVLFKATQQVDDQNQYSSNNENDAEVRIFQKLSSYYISTVDNHTSEFIKSNHFEVIDMESDHNNWVMNQTYVELIARKIDRCSMA